MRRGGRALLNELVDAVLLLRCIGGRVPSDDWRKYLKFRCTGCGNCCRRTTVLVGDEDVRRLEEGAGRQAREFIRFAPESDVQIEQRSPWWIRFGDVRAVMALRHRPGGACIFLDDDNRCTVYEHRPVTCREHPFEATISDTGAVQHIALSDIVDCPHAWDGQISCREVKAVARWNERQSDSYLDEVARWNRRRQGRKTRPAFLRYLGFDG